MLSVSEAGGLRRGVDPQMLDALLARSALSMTELAEQSGISLSQLSAMRRGDKTGVELGQRLEVLAALLGVDAAWLLRPVPRKRARRKGAQHGPGNG